MLRAMRRLMLLRHAKSDWSSPGMPDRDRPLNARGIADARTMNVYFSRHALIPELVLCSPAKRTRQTMDAIVKGWPKEVELKFADRLYEATPETIVSLIRAVPAAVHALLVIGHNPGLHETARMLVAAGDRGARGDRFSDRRVGETPSRIGTARPLRHPEGHRRRREVDPDRNDTHPFTVILRESGASSNPHASE